MPKYVHGRELPHDPPAFGKVRLAVRRHLREYPIVSRWDRSPISPGACCGFSGGPDSLALLCALAAEGVDVTALIVDHQLQPGSLAVTEYARRLAVYGCGIQARVLTVDVSGSPQATREAEAREARYRALGEAAGGYSIFVAHTQNDQAETYLLGALRGNPAGMPPVSPNPFCPTWPSTLRRPLLGISRETTAQACKELRLRPWQDPMNEDPAYLRVAVRKQILPALGELRAGEDSAIAPIAAAADRVAAGSEAVATWAETLDAASVENLREVPQAVRRRALASLVREAGGTVKQPTIAAIERLVTHWHGQGAVAIGNGRAIARKNGRLLAVKQPKHRHQTG